MFLLKKSIDLTLRESGQQTEVEGMNADGNIVKPAKLAIYLYVMTRLLKDRLCIKMTFMHND